MKNLIKEETKGLKRERKETEKEEIKETQKQIERKVSESNQKVIILLNDIDTTIDNLIF